MKTLTVVLALGLSSVAFAVDTLNPPMMGAQGMQRGQRLLQKFDLNQDGIITREEAQQVRQQNFQQADADNNGAVTVAEWQIAQTQRRAERMAQRFTGLDTDNNGTISEAEFLAGGKNPQGRGLKRANMFQHIDSNGDKQISKEELQARQGERQAQMQAKKNRGGKFFQLDSNNDGQVTLAELNAQLPLFDRLDTNKDGKIDAAEIQQMRGQGQGRGQRNR